MSRKILLLIIPLLLILPAAYGSSNIPTALKEYVTLEYPDGKDINWYKLGSYMYKASLLLDQKELVLYFDKAGKLIAREKQVMIYELPDNVLEKVKGKYLYDYIFEVTNSHGEHFFILEGKKNNARYDIIINVDGSDMEERLMSDPSFGMGKYGMLIGLIFVLI